MVIFAAFFCAAPPARAAGEAEADEARAEQRPERRVMAPGRGASLAWARFTHEARAELTGLDEAAGGGTPSAAVTSLHAGTGFPVYMGEKLRVFSGLNAAAHYFDFSGLDVGDIRVYDLSVPFTGTLKIGEKWAVIGMATPGIHSDMNNIDGRDFKTSFLLLADYAAGGGWNVVAGAAYSRIFGEDRLFPAAGFAWAPNENWTLRLVFPRPALLYSPGKRIRFSAGMEPSGGKWNIADPRNGRDNGDEYDFDFKGWRAGLGAEYDASRLFTISLEAFGVFRREYTITDGGGAILDSGVDDTFGLRLGISLRRFKN